MTQLTPARTYANYHVSLKILLRRGDEFLILNSQSGKFFDLPGGRIDEQDRAVLLEDILAREVQEELGPDLKYNLGEPLFQFRRHLKKTDYHVFVPVYDAEYLSGEIKLSDEHTGFFWTKAPDFKFQENQFLSAEEYRAFKKYFNFIIFLCGSQSKIPARGT